MDANAERTTIQLSLIREVSEMLGREGIEHWLFGGWGVDFLVGAITRTHDDVEFLIWQYDAELASSLLDQHGFRPLYAREDSGGWCKSGEKIELDLLTRRSDGAIVTPGWEEWPWPSGAFEGPVGRLGDITCRVVSAEAQRETKELYQRFRPGSGLRDKDRSDIAHLQRVIARQQRRTP